MNNPEKLSKIKPTQVNPDAVELLEFFLAEAKAGRISCAMVLAESVDETGQCGWYSRKSYGGDMGDILASFEIWKARYVAENFL